MNKVILTGRMVAEPELKTTTSGIETTTFRIAVNRDYVKQGEERKADFFDVVVWRQKAVFVCKYFHKGDGINVSGQLQSRTYQAKDGTNRYVVEVIADNVEFPLSKKSDNNSAPNTYTPPIQTPPTTAPPAPSADFQDMPVYDDLPF